MGRGSPGYCKLCNWEHINVLNRKLADLGEEVFTSQAALRLAKEMDPAMSFDRETWRRHKVHISHPLITAQKAALANPVVVPKTNEAKLQAIADIATERAMNHPEAVTVDHGLKALSILEQKKDRKVDLVVILARAMTGALPELEDHPMIGEWSEVEEPVNG